MVVTMDVAVNPAMVHQLSFHGWQGRNGVTRLDYIRRVMRMCTVILTMIVIQIGIAPERVLMVLMLNTMRAIKLFGMD